MSPARGFAQVGVRCSRPRLREGRWHAGAIGALAVLMGSLCIQPLLDGAWWLTRTIVVVAIITLVGGCARSLRVPAPLIPLLQFAALIVSLALLFARDEARWGFLPGPAAFFRLRELAAQGRDYSMATVPPAGPDPGLLLLIVAGIGLAALVVDTLAAGLDLPGMTLIPLATLFAVPWLVNRGSAPWWAFPLVALGWLAILSALQRDRASRWSPGARAGSPGTGLTIAAATTALALRRRWADDPGWSRRTRRHRNRVRRRDGGGGRAGLAAPVAGEQRHPAGDHPGDHRHSTRLPPTVDPRAVRRRAVAARRPQRRPAPSPRPVPMAASRQRTSRPGSPWPSTSSTSAPWAARPCRARTGPTSR